MEYQQAFDNFMSNGFQEACDATTESSWSGSRYFVELFKGGSYRILPQSSIGNRYKSPGMLLVVPILGVDEWDDDPDIRFYDNAEEEMQDIFAGALQDIKDYQNAVC